MFQKGTASRVVYRTNMHIRVASHWNNEEKNIYPAHDEYCENVFIFWPGACEYVIMYGCVCVLCVGVWKLAYSVPTG